MSEIITAPIDPLRAIEAMGTDRFQASTGEVLAATWDDAWTRNPTPGLYRTARRGLEDLGDSLSRVVAAPMARAGNPFALSAPAERLLSAAEATKEFGIEGQLQFDEEVTESRAAELRTLKQAEMRRADTIRRARGGIVEGAGNLATGFIASALDPLNIASAFVPVVGEARYATMLERAGSVAARAGVRARVGAIEGAVGAAVLEPIVYGVAREEQADYDAYDSLTNLAFGTILGGGLHVVGGAVSDWRTGWKPPMQVMAEAAGPQGRAASLGQAVAAVAEDRVPDDGVPLALTVAAKEREKWRPQRRGPAFSPIADVYDAAGRRVQTRMEVVEADDLITSNTDDLTINPAYPAELQPRQRERLVAQAQIQDIAAKLEPARLGASPDAASGAPIIDAGRIVESGNGRVLAIRRAYAEGGERSTAYRAWLEEQGFRTAGMNKPVLVRRRITELSAEDRRAFTVDAQKAATLDLSASERAAADAQVMDDIIPLMQGADVTTASNAPFVRAFVSKLAGGDQGSIVSKDGLLTPDGQRRINAALLARAFDDKDLLAAMLEGGEDGARSLAGAMLDIAPDWARMRGAAARGEIAPVDPTPDMLAAVKRIRDQRAQGRPLSEIMGQQDMFSPRNVGQDFFLRMLLTQNRNGETVLASRAAITRELGRYVEEANKTSPTPDLFGDGPPTPEAILEALEKRRDVMPGMVDDSDARVSQEADEVADLPPADPTALEADIQALDAEIKAAREAGILEAGEDDAVKAAQAMAEEAQVRTRQIEAAAFCLMRAA
jgi:hypothetical protein